MKGYTYKSVDCCREANDSVSQGASEMDSKYSLLYGIKYDSSATAMVPSIELDLSLGFAAVLKEDWYWNFLLSFPFD